MAQSKQEQTVEEAARAYLRKHAPGGFTVTQVVKELWGDVKRWGKVNLDFQAGVKDGSLKLEKAHPRTYAWPNGNAELAAKAAAKSKGKALVATGIERAVADEADPKGTGAAPGDRKAKRNPRGTFPKPTPAESMPKEEAGS